MFGFFTKESRISIRKRHLFCFLRGSSTLYCRVYNTERWVLPMNLYALSVNHRANPLGINSAEQPYFGWKLKSEKPNTMQAAYRLRIYADDTVCFDSGRVETAYNAFVCGPDLLRPQTFYRWAVTVWDNHGENTTAESSFETSLSAKEWKADWMRTTPRLCAAQKRVRHTAAGHAVSSRVYS